jgi:hypothetical protein
MTLRELQAKRDEILRAMGVARIQFEGRAIDYVADKKRELALLDAEIARLGSPQARQFTIQTERGLR